MKCTAIWGWLLAIGFLVGCQGETTKEDTGSAEPPSVTIPEAGENSAESAADDAEAPAGDPADADYDQSNADTASDVDATASDNTAVPNALELTPEEPSDPSEWTLDQFANELMGAAQGGDFTKAIEIANLALDKYPDSFEMQMNRMMLQLRIANALESQDKDQAAEQLVLVGDYARPRRNDQAATGEPAAGAINANHRSGDLPTSTRIGSSGQTRRSDEDAGRRDASRHDQL
jgi:hypothetical protein